MTDLKRAYEFFECAAIITANIVGTSGEKTDEEITNLLNSLFATMKVFDSAYVCTHGNNMSVTNTDWKNYESNAKEWIKLAVKNFN